MEELNGSYIEAINAVFAEKENLRGYHTLGRLFFQSQLSIMIYQLRYARTTDRSTKWAPLGVTYQRNHDLVLVREPMEIFPKVMLVLEDLLPAAKGRVVYCENVDGLKNSTYGESWEEKQWEIREIPELAEATAVYDDAAEAEDFRSTDTVGKPAMSTSMESK